MLVLVCDNLTRKAWCENRHSFDSPEEKTKTTRCYLIQRHEHRYIKFISILAGRLMAEHQRGPIVDDGRLHAALLSMVQTFEQMLAQIPDLHLPDFSQPSPSQLTKLDKSATSVYGTPV